MMRDFNDLQFFTAVVLNRGFSAAARALGVPKSRVSRRVALLEERLGVRLLDRTTRGLGLTQVGQQVFEHARAAVIEAEAAEEAALRMQAEPRGLVRLSCPLGLQSSITASMAGFLAAHGVTQCDAVGDLRQFCRSDSPGWHRKDNGVHVTSAASTRRLGFVDEERNH
jgi:DNA-binding transcriptional LysR family regulator